MMRLLLLSAFFFVMTVTMTAQQRLPGNQNIYEATGRGIIYDKEVNFSFGLNTPRNIFFGVRSGTLVTFDKLRFWSVSLGNIRHPRERRENPDRVNPVTNRISRAFTLGKINQLYALRVGFGTRKYLSEKARQRGVAIGYSYQVGPTLGLLKPYYVEFIVREPDGGNTIEDVRFTGDNAALFLNQDRIFGASTWTVGLSEIRPRPGIHVRGAAHFGFGAFDETPKILEVGMMADFFPGNTDLLLESELTPGVTNPPVFLSLFLNVQFGKRW